MRKPTTNPVTQTAKQHGYPATDYSWKNRSGEPNARIYAPFDGTIVSKGLAGDCGKRIQFLSSTGKTRITCCHLAYYPIHLTNKVKEGGSLGIMGWTGLTIPKGEAGRHLHLYIEVKNTRGTWVKVADPDLWLNNRLKEIATLKKQLAKLEAC